MNEATVAAPRRVLGCWARVHRGANWPSRQCREMAEPGLHTCAMHPHLEAAACELDARELEAAVRAIAGEKFSVQRRR